MVLTINTEHIPPHQTVWYLGDGDEIFVFTDKLNSWILLRSSRILLLATLHQKRMFSTIKWQGVGMGHLLTCNDLYRSS